jgi:hypothetical protein
MLQQRQKVLAKAPSTHDPKRTLAVRCGNGFEAVFSPYQSARSSR